MLDKIIAGITTIPLVFAGFLGLAPDQSSRIAHLEDQVSALQEEQSLGAFSPAAGGTYRLQTSIGTTDTTITLSSFKEPVSLVPITMTSLNSDIGYATIDPQSSTRKEFVSFSSVVQNSDGTATLSGVTRGLAFLSPHTASSTLRKAHPGQSVFILSDSPQLFNEYARKRSDETISGQWTFTNFPLTASTSFSSETVGGIVELATGVEAGSSTASGTAARLVLPASLATSSCPTAGLVVPITASSTGRIDESCLDNTWTGTTTFNGSINANQLATTGGYVSVTGITSTTSVVATSISANTLSTNKAIRASLPYRFLSTAGDSTGGFIAVGYGGSTSTMRIGGGGGSSEGKFEIILAANGATNKQIITISDLTASSSGIMHGNNASSTASVVADNFVINSDTAQPFTIEIRPGETSERFTIYHSIIEKLR